MYYKENSSLATSTELWVRVCDDSETVMNKRSTDEYTNRSVRSKFRKPLFGKTLMRKCAVPELDVYLSERSIADIFAVSCLNMRHKTFLSPCVQH